MIIYYFVCYANLTTCLKFLSIIKIIFFKDFLSFMCIFFLLNLFKFLIPKLLFNRTLDSLNSVGRKICIRKSSTK